MVGRICMDMCMVDITDVPEAKVGDTVTVVGTDGGETVTWDDWAGQLGTTPMSWCAISISACPGCIARTAKWWTSCNTSYNAKMTPQAPNLRGHLYGLENFGAVHGAALRTTFPGLRCSRKIAASVKISIMIFATMMIH